MIEKTTKTETVTTYRVNSAQVLSALALAGVIPAPEEGAEVAVEAITPYGVGGRPGEAFDIDENAHNWSGGLRITIKAVAQSTETGEPEVPKVEEPKTEVGGVELVWEGEDDDVFVGFGDLRVAYLRKAEGSTAPLRFVSMPEPKVRTRNPSPYRPKT